MKLWIVRFIFLILVLIATFWGIHKTNANELWTDSTYKLHNKISKMGVQKELGEYIINKCKKFTKDPLKCVKTAVAIYGNESGFGKHCKDNSCFGMVGLKFSSKKEAFNRWLVSYTKKWYKHTGGAFFYGSRGKLGPSHFCTSEVSSNSSVGCPNGNIVFTYIYSKI